MMQKFFDKTSDFFLSEASGLKKCPFENAMRELWASTDWSFINMGKIRIGMPSKRLVLGCSGVWFIFV